MYINIVQGKICKGTIPLYKGKALCYNNEKKPNIIIPAPGEEGQFARVVTMNNNFMTRSGRKVGAPKKFIFE